MLERLSGKVVVVIGGATGIGATTVRRLCQEGAKVFVGDLNENGLTALRSEFGEDEGLIQTIPTDQSDEGSVRNLFDVAREMGGRLDGLFLNGADTSTRSQGSDTDVVTIDLDLWDHIMRVNLRGYVLGLRHAIPDMLKSGGGAIVCTSSESSFIQADGLRPAYGVSKAGINALTRHVVARFGREGIRCNTIAPGIIQTETAARLLTPEKEERYREIIYSPRFGIPEDIAAAVAFLLADESAYLTGQVISINGGSLLR